MSTALLQAALNYATRQRLPVFPCLPRGKDPAVARGFYAATTNPETIRRYWRIADRNIGIPTGSISGFWVLDVDGEDGERSLRRLEAAHGALPPTREVITGDGRHFWFRYTGPIVSAAGRIAPSLDQRGDGGYVIVPSSIHQSGRIYTWAIDSADDLAIAPNWLLALARKKPISERALAVVRRPGNGAIGAYGGAVLELELAELAATQPGKRNDALNRTTFRLFQLVAGGELSEDEVVTGLIAACEQNGLVGDDGLRSVLATIRSGRKA